jgi:hypothetical protein
MRDPLDDGADGRLSAGTHRDQRRALIGAPRSRSAMVITRLPALPTRQPSTIVPRFGAPPLREAILSVDNTTASELPVD